MQQKKQMILFDPDALLFQDPLNRRDINRPASDIVFQRHRGGDAGTLAGNGTTHHLAGSGVGNFVSGNTAACN